MVICPAGTWASSANSQGRSRSDGIGRVMSGITTPTRSRAPTRSGRGGAPRGRPAGPPPPRADRGRLVAEPVHEPRPDHRDIGRLRHEVEAVRAVLKVE